MPPPPPPPPDTFPRQDYGSGAVYTRGPWLDRTDVSDLVLRGARNASTHWQNAITNSSVVVTRACFILATLDKVLETTLWLRSLRIFGRPFPQTVAEWQKETDALVPRVYELAVAALPSTSPSPPPLAQVAPIVRIGLDCTFEQTDAAEKFSRAARPTFDQSILEGFLHCPFPRPRNVSNLPPYRVEIWPNKPGSSTHFRVVYPPGPTKSKPSRSALRSRDANVRAVKADDMLFKRKGRVEAALTSPMQRMSLRDSSKSDG